MLLQSAFRARHADESHRARLRVEIGRLRKALAAVAGVEATRDGFALKPLDGREVVVLAPPMRPCTWPLSGRSETPGRRRRLTSRTRPLVPTKKRRFA